MEHVFLNVLNIVLPVLICAGVGYGLVVARAPFEAGLPRGWDIRQ